MFHEERNQFNRLVSAMVDEQLHCNLRKHIQIDDNRLQLWYVVSLLVLAVGLEIFRFIDCISSFFSVAFVFEFCVFASTLYLQVSPHGSVLQWVSVFGCVVCICSRFLNADLFMFCLFFCQNFSFKVPTLAKTINRMQMDYSFYINLNISTCCVVGMCIEAGMLTS